MLKTWVELLDDEELRRADAACREIVDRLAQQYGRVCRPCNWVVVALERLAEALRWRHEQ